ncbi:MAG: peptidoglycan DD-metalloendopeptidase family protein [Rickettsiaceae bacterium]|nr:peptidoglycan DD-metalloendopeptidase family protein [Rickettsiaceae bacterium]
MIQFLALCTIFTLTACSVSKQTAPIEYHHSHKSMISEFSQSQQTYQGQVIDYDDNIIKSSDTLNVTSANLKQKIIYHEVKLEETIEDIAEQYGQSVSDVAKLNNIEPPYDISEYQILKLYDKSQVIQENDLPEVINLNHTSDSSDQNNINKKTEFVQPVQGQIISKFGDKTELGHNKGINIAALEGTEVVASKAGKVVYSNYDATYGNLVIIKLDQSNMFLTYAHLKSTELGIGDHVSQGEIIGFVGKTGKVSSPQLHFGIRDGKTPKNPIDYIKY